jgi:hypothetical protein
MIPVAVDLSNEAGQCGLFGRCYFFKRIPVLDYYRGMAELMRKEK